MVPSYYQPSAPIRWCHYLPEQFLGSVEAWFVYCAVISRFIGTAIIRRLSELSKATKQANMSVGPCTADVICGHPPDGLAIHMLAHTLHSAILNLNQTLTPFDFLYY